MKDYSKTLYLLRESSFSRDSLFISELVEEVRGLFNESIDLLDSKVNNIETTELQEYEKQITELRYIRSKLLEILKVGEE